MEPLGLASIHLWWVLAASWCPEQFALVMHDPFLWQQLGRYCGSMASDPLTPPKANSQRPSYFTHSLRDFLKLQIHGLHKVDACHSILPTTHISHRPNGTFLHSVVHSLVAHVHPLWASPPCPHSLTFLSPDTLDGGFPSGPMPSGSPCESTAPLTSNSPKSSGRGPSCSGARTV